ncbi:AtpZ/AtpI family protein [Ponticaulis sp.]|uniref:AtpZ/AtpI family protein n=1 Tax=Ponticaulis sp. TaxID=2020902 RepID=UPI000B642038|nr:AtpZ/AtpI family protein [Ponticaulis sp.]MAI91490.1 hypothetical protein [Ponticaulis sp.]OUX97842.1 MAG: hypothetical protein CBB65_13690 [Hyphomonadaceae bacterium TMED5]|tara:strand:- start:845 stop:1201 length:357 start_codon:yes stop_codon:yes gene_type:complete
MPPSSPEPDDLGARIAAAQAKQAQKTARKPKSSGASGYGLGMKMVLDLIGGVLVGMVFGLALDHVAGTKPWGLLVLLCLGLATGLRMMLRTANQEAKRFAEETNSSGTTDVTGEKEGK